MSFTEKTRIFLGKLRNLPEDKKKVILWAIVIVIGLTMGYFWVKDAMNGISKITESVKSVKLPAINLPQMPSLDVLQTTTPTNK